jgi:hypothetical protein
VDEKEAYAIGFANLKGGKDKDIPATAKALKYFKDSGKYNSNKEVGSIFDVSGEIVREFLAYFKMPREIQQLFEGKKLTQLEQLRRLYQLKRNHPKALETLVNATNEISDLKSHDGRHVIEYMIKHPDVSAADVKKIVLDSKTINKREYFVMAQLDDREYRILSKEAKKKNISETSLATEVLKYWINDRGL